MKMKKKKDYTHISFVLDRSGSMTSCIDSTISNFNEFLQSQRETPGEATFTLVQFNQRYNMTYDFRRIDKVTGLNRENYRTGGSTALFDAIGDCINITSLNINELEKNEQPEKIIFVILTDGFENASRKYNGSKINEMINKKTSEDNWEFVFLGANQDAIVSAESIGINRKYAFTFDASNSGTKNFYDLLKSKITSYRRGVTDSMEIADDDRDLFDEKKYKHTDDN